MPYELPPRTTYAALRTPTETRLFRITGTDAFAHLQAKESIEGAELKAIDQQEYSRLSQLADKEHGTTSIGIPTDGGAALIAFVQLIRHSS